MLSPCPKCGGEMLLIGQYKKLNTQKELCVQGHYTRMSRLEKEITGNVRVKKKTQSEKDAFYDSINLWKRPRK